MHAAPRHKWNVTLRRMTRIADRTRFRNGTRRAHFIHVKKNAAQFPHDFPPAGGLATPIHFHSPPKKNIMKTPVKSVLAIFCAAALCCTASARPAAARAAAREAVAHTAQPEMNQAIAQLEEAKHAGHPVAHLEKAKHDLEDARHNKHGERVEALKHVHAAIEAAHHDKHKAMEEHINAAIHDIREGKHAARN